MRNRPFFVELTRDAEKDLESNRLRSHKPRLIQSLLRLETDPYAGHALKESLKGCRSLEFSLPGGSVYRAVYIVLPSEAICVLFIIGPHEGIYAKARRRFEALKRSGRI